MGACTEPLRSLPSAASRPEPLLEFVVNACERAVIFVSAALAGKLAQVHVQFAVCG
jgi:hypothetical protein